jgi:putative membrane-bound dehydrogenase-like protein
MNRLALTLCFALTAFNLSRGVLAQEAAQPREEGSAPRAGLFPLGPEESARAIQVAPGFRVELFAAEPHVASPVALTFAADGDVYVAEMLDYPIIRTPGMFGPFPEGQIRLLRTDDRGQVVQSTVFALAIEAPTSLVPYEGGVLVAAAPDILFLKDTDGDGHADVRKVVLTGFDASQDLYRLNSLQWGIDGWIYARGVGNTPIHWADDPEGKALSTEGMDFRFRPRQKQFEAIAGRSGCFGLTIDDWGHRFFSNSASHVYQVVLANHYLRRNPFLTAPPLTREISDHGGVAPIFRISPPQPWRVERSEIWEKSGLNQKYFGRIEPRQDYMTATCGAKIYRETAFPPQYRGNYFVCEAVGNLVHRDVLNGPGPVYSAARGEQGREFLASADNWCSPVGLETGPDGALYVVDMYRQIIEHAGADGGRDVPNVPLEVLRKYGLRAGSTMGRIYRVRAEGAGAWSKPHLSGATPAELAVSLGSPNAWWRTTAQRLILERPGEVEPQAIAAVARTSPHPAARLQALWTLEALGMLDNRLVAEALTDAVPGVRENAVRMAEARLVGDPALEAVVLGLADDPAPSVRLQVALTLGELAGPRRLPALASLARHDGADPYLRAAVLTSVGDDPLALFRSLAGEPASAGTKAVLEGLAQVIGARLVASEVGALLVEIDRIAAGSATDTAASGLRALAQGIKRRGKRGLVVSSGQPALRRLLSEGPEPLRRAAGELAPLVGALSKEERAAALAQAAAASRDMARPIEERAGAIQSLGLGDFAAVAPTLTELLHPRNPEPLQVAALEALDELPGPAVVTLLVERWPSLTPSLRPRAIAVAMGRTERLGLLLEAVKRGTIPISAFDSGQRASILGARSKAVAELARQVFGNAASQVNPKLVEAHRSALDLMGDAQRGRVIFRARCLTCHKVGREGTEIGPSLVSVRDRPREQVLQDMVAPNLSVQPQYNQFLVETQSGQIFSGLIQASDATSVTLRRPGAGDVTLLRKDIEALSGTGVSVMPEGLLTDLKPQEVADLLEYVKRME